MRYLLNANIFCFALFYYGIASAGGPIALNGNTPVTYQDSNITISVEGGDLGSLTNSEANALLQQALDLWNNEVTSSINLSLDTDLLNFDIDSSNYSSYIPATPSTVFNSPNNTNPLIYDNDGSITDIFFGMQNGTVIGFAGSSTFSTPGVFEEGFIVINGLIANQPTDDVYVLTLAHEIGHFFGLDHSQANINNQEAVFSCNSNSSDYPLMYPIACRITKNLHSDDISAVSALYPDVNFNASFGILEGRLLTDIGSALLGANIWVENTQDGLVYSIVSDYLREGTGFYRLYLPAGTYKLHANSINTQFFAGSGLGPYANHPTDISFTAPHPITPFTHQNAAGNDVIVNIAVSQIVTVNFNSIDATPPPTPPDTKGKGAIPHLTLLLTLTILVFVRRTKRPD